VAPPRFMFRFLLPQIEKKELQGCRLSRNMWTIPYRLLPLALTLPAIGCRIEGQTRKEGKAIRHINC